MKVVSTSEEIFPEDIPPYLPEKCESIYVGLGMEVSFR